MDNFFWILVSSGVLVLLIVFAGIFTYLASKNKLPKRNTDYKAWFVIGLCWVGVGIPLAITTQNYGLLAIGIVFLVLGFMHKKDWENNRIKFKDLTPFEKKFKVGTIILLGFLILGLGIYFWLREMF